jgi:predicted  nucleic acid-binding Zn-ribbon protein
MEPEISHRCASCGAAVRGGGEFCPQCGTRVNSSPAIVSYNADTSGKAKSKATKQLLTTRPLVSETKAVELPFPAQAEHEPSVQSESAKSDGEIASHAAGPVDESLSKRQRVKDKARGMVEGNVRPRVEKLRQASSVVIEEASAIDPSLRFILIAAFLFIVFIVLLVLSFIR